MDIVVNFYFVVTAMELSRHFKIKRNGSLIIFFIVLILVDNKCNSYETAVGKHVYLDIKLYDTDGVDNEYSFATKAAIGVGIGALGAGAVVAAVPTIIAGAGFTGAGIAGGSLAATWQATIGNVIGGTAFSALQSAGAAGLGLMGYAASSAVGATAGGLVGLIVAKSMTKKVSLIELEDAFLFFEKEDKKIIYDDIDRILKGLDLNLSGEELEDAYTKATGRSVKEPATYEEFLRLFGVKLLTGEDLKNKLHDEFVKSVSPSKMKMSLEDLKEMFKKLGVNISRKDLESSFLFVTNDYNSDQVSIEILLKMCGF